MKKFIILFGLFVFICGNNIFAQNGRPEPLVNNDNAPKITVRNENDPTKIALAKISERLTSLENKVASLETDNASLKTQNAALQKKITDLSTAQDANYKVLDYSLSQLNKKFSSQVGTFRINGFVSSQSVLASGATSKLQLLTGIHE